MTDEDEVRIELPEGPRCRKCGHMPCPFCLDWCDSILANGELCCDSRCDFDPEALEAWKKVIGPILDEAPEEATISVKGDLDASKETQSHGQA